MDRPEPFEPHVFLRGNPNQPGPVAPRRMPAAVFPSAAPFRSGSGRLELARAIVDPANPLTARVFVNRVWMHHFGRGLVATPGDFVVAEIKSAVFGFLAAIVAAHKGLNAKGGPKGVAEAVNQSVVLTFLLLFSMNIVMTQAYLLIAPPQVV